MKEVKPGLEKWHHDIHQVTGTIVLVWHNATEEDINNWSKALSAVAKEMKDHAKQIGKKVPRGKHPLVDRSGNREKNRSKSR